MMPTAIQGLGTLLGGGLMGGTGGNVAGYYPANTVWQQWNTQYLGASTAATANTVTVWFAWNDAYMAQAAGQQVNQVQPSAEHLEKIEKARTRAKELLLEHLSPEQKESYEKHGMFIVEGSKKNRYRLAHSNAPRRVRDEKDVTAYCIHTSGVPREDELLGFKLLLEANEDEFLKTANATQLAA